MSSQKKCNNKKKEISDRGIRSNNKGNSNRNDYDDIKLSFNKNESIRYSTHFRCMYLFHLFFIFFLLYILYK